MSALSLILLYFGMLAANRIDWSRREKDLLTVFGQKMTHALRSSLMEKFIHLTTDNVNRTGAGNAGFAVCGRCGYGGKPVHIRHYQHVCRYLQDRQHSGGHLVSEPRADVRAAGTAAVPVCVHAARTEKYAGGADREPDVPLERASGHVPETLHNIRTIHCLNKEAYMEEQYDSYIGRSYRAMEKTNFYDAVYSPVILILNAVVVAVVMLLSGIRAIQNVLTLFRDVRRNSSGRHQLYLPNLHTGGESWAWRFRPFSRRSQGFTGSTSSLRWRNGQRIRVANEAGEIADRTTASRLWNFEM